MRPSITTVWFAACAAIMGTTAGFEALLLAQQSDYNKAMPVALMCFDHSGKPTLGTDWSECRAVKYKIAG